MLQSGSPRSIIRESQIVGLLSEESAKYLLIALEDRNRAVHVYREALAIKIVEHLGDYETLFLEWIVAMEARLGE